MRVVAAMFVMCASLATARDVAKPAPPKKAAAARTAAPRKTPVDIPEDAKKIGDYLWTNTDAKGKTWYYRQTPFGVAKTDQPPRAPEPDTDTPRERVSPFAQDKAPQRGSTVDTVVLSETADEVKFQRPSPFAMQVWTRKKSEMNDEERRAYERSKGTAAKAQQ